MARVVAGDAGALAELYDDLGGYVLGLARQVTRDHAMAEEVTQDVFCQLWSRPGRFDPARGSVRAFLGVLAHRRSVDRVRQQEAARRRDTGYRHDHPAAVEPDVADEVTARLEAAEVRSAVAELPESQRRPVVLAYFGGHTFREVAAILNIPEGTAKSRIRLALSKLGSSLTQNGTLSRKGGT